MRRGWIWVGDKASRYGPNVHGYPCTSRRNVQAMEDVMVRSDDVLVPVECPACGAEQMQIAAKFFYLHTKRPARQIVTLNDYLELRRQNEATVQIKPTSVQDISAAEYAESSRLLR